MQTFIISKTIKAIVLASGFQLIKLTYQRAKKTTLRRQRSQVRIPLNALNLEALP